MVGLIPHPMPIKIYKHIKTGQDWIWFSLPSFLRNLLFNFGFPQKQVTVGAAGLTHRTHRTGENDRQMQVSV